MPTKISGRDKRKQNKTEQNEEEFLPEASERKSTSSYPIFKPVSSPDFQIVADNVFSETAESGTGIINFLNNVQQILKRPR